MITQEGEGEVFEITDYTTSSEWEIFVASIEAVLQDWKIASKPLSRPPQHTHHIKPHFGKKSQGTEFWYESSVPIKYADYEFTMSLHKLMSHKPSDTNSSDNSTKADKKNEEEKKEEEEEEEEEDCDASQDKMPTVWKELLNNEDLFPCRAHCLHRWFGLRELVVISTVTREEDVNSESRLNMLLSSATMATFNTKCHMPIFIQAGMKWRKLFYGTLDVPGFRTSFEMVQFKKPQFDQGLRTFLDIFKEKIACPKEIRCSIDGHFTYSIHDWSMFPYDLANCKGTYCELPVGSLADPIRVFMLQNTWSGLPEEMIDDLESDTTFMLDNLNDSLSEKEIYALASDTVLDPFQDYDWSVNVHSIDDTETIIGSYLKSALNLCKETYLPFTSIDNPQQGDTVKASAALDRLTKPYVPTIDNVIKKATSTQMNASQSNVPEALFNVILMHLFSENSEPIQGWCHSTEDPPSYIQFEFDQLKAAEIGSLTYKLAVALCYLYRQEGGYKTMMQLWKDFVLEMRFRWENGIKIPGLADGPPNMGSCLLHQKLQMLNCCIERKKKREQTPPTDSKTNGESSSEDEFFDSRDKDDGSDEKAEPEGRLRLLDADVKLLNFPERYLYVPITQEPAPMTEDLLEEHVDVLSSLGTSQESTKLRARMQSACLLSDMEAFKAANPGCCLEDFVRWYSPRDFKLTSDRWGELSQRMRLEDNMWVETWQNARSIPVAWQRRLFDDTKEAEKVLHWLASLKAHQVSFNIMPLLMTHAVLQLSRCEECQLPFIEASIKKLKLRLVEASRCVDYASCAASCIPGQAIICLEKAVQLLIHIELGVVKARSLLTKLLVIPAASRSLPRSELLSFVSSVLNFPEVNLSASFPDHHVFLLKKIIYSVFLYAKMMRVKDTPSEKKKKFNRILALAGRLVKTSKFRIPRLLHPKGKEYVLRALCNRPAPWSRMCPQRMYCFYSFDEYRLAGAFTDDVIFF